MAKQTKSLSKVLDWEALATAPNTHGAFSFLKTAAEVINIQDAPFHKSSVLGTTEPAVMGYVPTPAADASPLAGHEQARGAASDMDTGVHMDTVADMTTVVALDSVAGMKVVLDLQAESDKPGDLTRSLRPLKCRSVQDAHTLGETVLYSLLWSTAKPETDETKIFQLGWRQMASLRKGMGDKFCKRNVGGLIRKLALECIRPENTYKREARTYRIHSFKNILVRRKAAGYEWVTRDKRRAFVQEDGTPFPDPQTSEIQDGDTDIVSISTTVDTYPSSYPDTVVLSTPETVVIKTPGTGVLKSPPLVSSLGTTEEEIPTTTEVDSIVTALAAVVELPDVKAAVSLLAACRAACPDATTEEIIGVTREKAFAARARRDVRNPMGFLLRTVPLVFEGAGIKSYRRIVAAEAEAARQAEAERKRNEAETVEYFSRQRERLQVQLSDTTLTEKGRADICRRVGEFDSYLKRSATEKRSVPKVVDASRATQSTMRFDF